MELNECLRVAAQSNGLSRRLAECAPIYDGQLSRAHALPFSSVNKIMISIKRFSERPEDETR